MAVPIHVAIVDRLSTIVLATHAAYPNEDGSLSLTGAIDLPAGTYDLAVRITADPGTTVNWAGGALQVILGQPVSEPHCPGEAVN